MAKIRLYTDGGAELRVSGGSAAIVENEDTGARVHLASFIGGATNNEAEIFASLLGYAFLQVCDESFSDVHWVCDSEYVLKSATGYIINWQKNGWKTAGKKPVKNQGLWKTYLELSKGFKITPEHVMGHTGHPENELCDQAATWVKQLEGTLNGEGEVLESPIEDISWIVVDGSEILERLRNDEPTEELKLELCRILKDNSWTSFSSLGGAIKPNALRPVINHLNAALQAANKSSDERAGELAEELSELLNKYQ